MIQDILAAIFVGAKMLEAAAAITVMVICAAYIALRRESDKPKRKRKREELNGPAGEEDTGEIVSEWYEHELDRAESFKESVESGVAAGLFGPRSDAEGHRRY
jgi:hypothetical protein